MTIVRSCAVVLTLGMLMLLISGIGGLAQEGGTSPPAPADQLFESLSPWALAVFVWLVLFLAMAFIVAVALLSRPRRY